MKILVIGGTKFIGPFVVKLLHAAGHEVILFNRGQTHFNFPFSIRQIHDDRAKIFQHKSEFEKISPDVVIDMIAYSENDARQLIEVCSGLAKRIIVISSCDVYKAYDRLWKKISGAAEEMPLTEFAALRTNYFPYRKPNMNENDWHYNYEKILVERLIQASSIRHTILRLPMVYGPNDYYRIYPYLKLIDSNQPIVLDSKKSDWRFSRAYVEDVAYAIYLATLDTRLGNFIYNVGETTTYSEYEWVEKIKIESHSENQIIILPTNKLPRNLVEDLAWEQDLILDTSSIRRELKYQEVCVNPMQKTIYWLRTQKITESNISE